MIARLTDRLIEKLNRKSYREAYVEEHVRTGISYQIRAMRDLRGWSQKKLAEVLKKPQSVVSRLEDPDYGKPSVQTLVEIASAFDVALVIQFLNFPEFLQRTRDVSPDALAAESFDPAQLRSPSIVDSNRVPAAKITLPTPMPTNLWHVRDRGFGSQWSNKPIQAVNAPLV